MKLFTRPRPLLVGWLRPGDQLAMRDNGAPVDSEAAYIDADLRGKIGWTTVREVKQADPIGNVLRVVHARGDFPAFTGSPVIAREVIELDPWSYVDRSGLPRPDQP